MRHAVRFPDAPDLEKRELTGVDFTDMFNMLLRGEGIYALVTEGSQAIFVHIEPEMYEGFRDQINAQPRCFAIQRREAMRRFRRAQYYRRAFLDPALEFFAYPTT